MISPDDFPYAVVLGFLLVVGMCRGQGTYWLARIVTEQALRRTHPVQGWRLRLHTWLSDGAADRGREILNRWGLAAVPLCYLTVGVQTIVLATAGVTRIGWARFTLAQLPGALAWAVIYSTIGLAVWEAAVLRHWPLLLFGFGALTIAAVMLRRRRARAAG